MSEEWIKCPTCKAEGEVDMEWIGKKFVSGSGRTCPTCKGDMAVEPDDPSSEESVCPRCGSAECERERQARLEMYEEEAEAETQQGKEPCGDRFADVSEIRCVLPAGHDGQHQDSGHITGTPLTWAGKKQPPASEQGQGER